ncbi:sugar (and other) transporter family protein, partial [Vibrio parahaemolyticus V-223/04]
KCVKNRQDTEQFQYLWREGY